VKPACKTAGVAVVLAALGQTALGVQSTTCRGVGELDINVRKRSQVQVIQLRGQLRLGEPVDELRRTFEEALAQGDTGFVLNLAEVPMMDSSGIGVIMHFFAATKQRGGSLKLVQPSGYAVKTLRLVGVLNLFEVFDSDDAAVASFA
jgi:anti-anti-sigma factor